MIYVHSTDELGVDTTEQLDTENFETIDDAARLAVDFPNAIYFERTKADTFTPVSTFNEGHIVDQITDQSGDTTEVAAFGEEIHVVVQDRSLSGATVRHARGVYSPAEAKQFVAALTEAIKQVSL